MSIYEAFNMLNLPLGSGLEEINNSYKQILLHNYKTYRLTRNLLVDLGEAKKLTDRYNTRKTSKLPDHEDLYTIQDIDQIKNNLKYILEKKERELRGKYDPIKEAILLSAIFSISFSILSDKLVQNLLRISEDSFSSSVFYAISVTLGLFYLSFVFVIKRLEKKLSMYNLILDNEHFFLQILLDALGEKIKAELSRNEIYDIIESRFCNRLKCKIISSIRFILYESKDVKGLLMMFGCRDLGEILLLKGLKFGIIKEVDYINMGNYDPTFRFRGYD